MHQYDWCIILWQDKTTRQYHYVGGREGRWGGPIRYEGIYYFSSWQSYVVGDREKYWLIGDSDLVIAADIVMTARHPLPSPDLLLNSGSVYQPNQPRRWSCVAFINVINILSNIDCPFALFINQLMILYTLQHYTALHYTWLLVKEHSPTNDCLLDCLNNCRLNVM